MLAAVIVFTSSDDGSEANETSDPTSTVTPPPKIACEGERPPPADPQTYSQPPPMQLEDGVDYSAVITTSCGEVEVDLLEDKAPQNVNNFVFLAEEGFYNGLTFHRVEQNSIIQGGDPEGTGHGGPGYTIPDELPKDPTEYTFGRVAMANNGPNTAGSQFFIVVHDNPSTIKYDPAGYRPWYSIFGEVDPSSPSGEVITTISQIRAKIGDDPAIATQPTSTIYIESVEIGER